MVFFENLQGVSARFAMDLPEGGVPRAGCRGWPPDIVAKPDSPVNRPVRVELNERIAKRLSHRPRRIVVSAGRNRPMVRNELLPSGCSARPSSGSLHIRHEGYRLPADARQEPIRVCFDCPDVVVWTIFHLKETGHVISVTIKLYFPTVILKMNHIASISRRTDLGPHVSQNRIGVAAAELALALPLLVALVFGSMELADGFFFEEAVITAAYEGAREAAQVGGTETRAREAVKSVMASRGITDFRVKFSWHRHQLKRGDDIWCTVLAKRSSWSPVRFGYLGDFETERGVMFKCQ